MINPIGNDDKKIRATVQDLLPTINNISTNISKLADPNSKFHKRFKNDAEGWADFLKEAEDACCAFHVYEIMREIRATFVLAISTCKQEGCTDNINHEFLQELVKIIDIEMSKITKELAIKQELQERIN